MRCPNSFQLLIMSHIALPCLKQLFLTLYKVNFYLFLPFYVIATYSRLGNFWLLKNFVKPFGYKVKANKSFIPCNYFYMYVAITTLYYCNVTSSHLRLKEFINIHKPCIPHSRDTTKCTPVYIQMQHRKVVLSSLYIRA